MLPYYLLICVSLIFPLITKYKPKYHYFLLIITAFLCWLFSSLRYVIGFDYRFYEGLFNTVSETGIGGLLETVTIEPGYLLLNFLVFSLGGSYRVFLLLFHLLLTFLIFSWIDRYSHSPWLSIYLFITLQYFALSMNFLRQAFAAAIILWIYPFLKTRRFLPCFGIIFLASCFHWTALIMIPLCLLLTRKPSRIHYSTAILAAGITYLFMDSVIGFVLRFAPKYQHYLTEKYWQGNSILYILLPFGCFLFILPLLQQELKCPDSSPVLANAMFYSLLIQIFITKHFILERFSIYTAFFALLALPESLNAPCRLSRKARTGILITGSLVYFLFAVHQGFHGVYPYRGIWDMAL